MYAINYDNLTAAALEAELGENNVVIDVNTTWWLTALANEVVAVFKHRVSGIFITKAYC